MAHLLFSNLGRTLPLARVLLAATLFLLSVTDTGDPGFKVEADDIAAVVYLGLAAGLALLAERSWWWDIRLLIPAMAVDLFAFITIPMHIEPAESGYLLGSTLIAIWMIVDACWRWNWRRAVAVAIGLNLICLAICGIPAVGTMLGGMADYGPFQLRRAAYLLLTTALMVLLLARFTSRNLPVFTPSPHVGLDHGLTNACAYVAWLTGAAQVRIFWHHAHEATIRSVATGAASNEGGNDGGNDEYCAEVPKLPGRGGPVICDRKRGRIAELDERTGLISTTRHARLDLPAGLECGQGLVFPIVGGSGQGVLFATGIPVMTWDHLRQAAQARQLLAMAIDRHDAELRAIRQSLDEERARLSRDLHDSVSQSLAATKLWLGAFKLNLPADSTAHADAERMQAALRDEYDHVRRLIVRLAQPEVALPPGLSPAADLARQVAMLGFQWRTDIAWHLDDPGLQLRESAMQEIRHLVGEAVSNAVRHGPATQVEVSLRRIPDGELVLAVSDDGPDLGNAAPVPPQSLGQRLARLGGRLAVTRQSGKTLIEMTLPAGAIA